MKILGLLLVLAGLATSTGFLALGVFINDAKGFDYAASHQARTPGSGDNVARPTPTMRSLKADY